MSKDILKKAIMGVVAIRFAALSIAAFLPLTLPSIWRQTDTMGVSLRYWLRWTVEPGARHGFFQALLPAVLNSGDSSGIMPMEFPALNLLFAPAFALGPYWGRVFCMLGVLALVHGLLALNVHVWRNNRESLGVDPFFFFLVAIASFTSGWTGKFMPDLISAELVLLALGLSWERSRFSASAPLAALGLLMKPTAVVVLFLQLVHPKGFRRSLSNAPWVGPALILTLLYYTLGTRWIANVGDGPGLFAVQFRPVLESLRGFFSDVHDWSNMWMYRAFFSLGLIPILAFSLLPAVKKAPGLRWFSVLWMVFLVQYVVIAAMDGTHAFFHDYYFIGLAPTACLIIGYVMTDLMSRRWGGWAVAGLLLGILAPTVELSSMDLRALYKAGYKEQCEMANACLRLKARNPEAHWNTGQVYRSPPEEFPSLGLCFGERQGSATAPFGFFHADAVPKECKPIDTDSGIVLAGC